MINPSLNQKERNIAEDNIIKDIRNLLELKKKKDNDIKDKKIRDIRFLFESDDYCEPIRIGNAFSSNFNIKVMEITAKHYQLKNILIWLDHTWVI